MIFKKRPVAYIIAGVVVVSSLFGGALMGLNNSTHEVEEVFFDGIDGERSLSDAISDYQDHAEKLESLMRVHDGANADVSDIWYDIYEENDYDKYSADAAFVEEYGELALYTFGLTEGISSLEHENDFDDSFNAAWAADAFEETYDFAEMAITELKNADLSESEMEELAELEAYLMDTEEIENLAEIYNEEVERYDDEVLSGFPTNLLADYFYWNSYLYSSPRTFDI